MSQSKTCCCPHPNRWRCAEWRYGEPQDEPCECWCHELGEDEDDEPVLLAVPLAKVFTRLLQSIVN